MKKVAGPLRLELAQYREMAAFAQFGSDLDAATRRQLDRGQRLVEVMKQGQFAPLPVEKQIAIIYAATHGHVDALPVDAVQRFERELYAFLEAKHAALLKELREKKELVPGLQEKLEAALAVVGRKGFEYYRRRSARLIVHRLGILTTPPAQLAADLAGELTRRFAAEESDAAYLLYNRFRSAISQVPTPTRLLPVATPESDVPLVDYILEPERGALLARLLPRYVEALITQALLEAVASEHGARMTAMDNATTNATEMIGSLTLSMNRARQAAITKELMEIVSGAEALKG